MENAWLEAQIVQRRKIAPTSNAGQIPFVAGPAACVQGKIRALTGSACAKQSAPRRNVETTDAEAPAALALNHRYATTVSAWKPVPTPAIRRAGSVGMRCVVNLVERAQTGRPVRIILVCANRIVSVRNAETTAAVKTVAPARKGTSAVKLSASNCAAMVLVTRRKRSAHAPWTAGYVEGAVVNSVHASREPTIPSVAWGEALALIAAVTARYVRTKNAHAHPTASENAPELSMGVVENVWQTTVPAVAVGTLATMESQMISVARMAILATTALTPGSSA